MGKARIVGGGADGSYTVELLHNRDRIQSELDFLAAKLEELQAELDVLETERADLVTERDAVAIEIDEIIAAAAEGEIPDVEALLIELTQVSAQIQAHDVRIALIQGRRLETNTRKAALEAVPEDPQQQAWCADFTENLTGEVGTVEVLDEGETGQFLEWRRVIVRPGYEGRADYLPSRDGQMFHREGQVGYQVYFNAAILPGVQKWRPQYRIGTLTLVNKATDTCNLNLQSEDSSANSLLVDPPNGVLALTGVPIEYMSCDSVPFEVGDRVLVEFQNRDWEQPRVIGFEKEPKSCLPRYIEVPVSSSSVDAYNPMNTWEATQTEILDCPDPSRNVQCYYRGGLLYNTRLDGFGGESILHFIDYTVPDGYSAISKGLWGYWNEFEMDWSSAVPYGDTVGGDVFGNKPPAPQEFALPVDSYLNAGVSESTFAGTQDTTPSFIRLLSAVWLRTMNTQSFYIPMLVNGDDDPVFADIGYNALYRINCHASLEPQPSYGSDIYPTGSYSLEKLTDNPAVIASDYFDIPAVLTVPVGPGSASTVTYNRVTVGWRVRPGGTDSRVLSAIYALEGEPAPAYAPGFWAT